MVVDLTTDFAAAIGSIQEAKISFLVIDSRQFYKGRGRRMGDEYGLVQHIGIASVELEQQSSRGTDMESDFGIDGRIGLDVVLDDAGVDEAIAILLHILL